MLLIFSKLINTREIKVIQLCFLSFITFFLNVKTAGRTAEMQMQHSRQMILIDATEQVNDRETEREC